MLDFVNTVTARNAEPVDWLDSYPRVLEWAALSGHVDQSELATLARLSTADPSTSVRALGLLRELREAVHDLIAAMIRHEPAPETSRARFERHWRDGVGAARLSFRDGVSGLDLDVGRSRLEYVRHDLALRALELLRELPLERTRVCAGLKCGWLFIDRSKGGQRRWCDMATCGNAAKSRRHYQQKRAAKR